MAGKTILSLETGPMFGRLSEALSPEQIPLVKKAYRAATATYMQGVRNQLKAVTPVGKRRQKNPPGNLKRATKSRSSKGGGATLYIDKTGGRTGSGYHWHLVVHGSKTRRTKAGANRGAMPAKDYLNPVIDRAASQAAAVIEPLTSGLLKKRLDKLAGR